MSDANLMKSESFRFWFSDSKVVDDSGHPLVVYHGTAAEIERFTTSPSGVLGRGIYFTECPAQASEFAKHAVVDATEITETDVVTPDWARPSVIPVYLSLQNPFFVKDSNVPNDLAEQGYDGVIFGREGERYYVAFYPEQIKSAIGNSGGFDPKSPDICDSRDLAERSPLHWRDISDEGPSL